MFHNIPSQLYASAYFPKKVVADIIFPPRFFVDAFRRKYLFVFQRGLISDSENQLSDMKVLD